MDYWRTKFTFFLSFSFALYILTFKKSSEYTPSNQPTLPTSSNPLKYIFEGSETNSENLILAFLDKKSKNDTATFRLYRYQGPYESEELNYLSFHCTINTQNHTIINDPHYFYATNFPSVPKPLVRLEVTYKEIHKLQGKIFNSDELFLDFSLEFMDQKVVYFKRLAFGLGASFLYLIYFLLLDDHCKKCEASEIFAGRTSLMTLGLIQLYELSFTFWLLKKAFEKPIELGIDFMFILAFWSFGIYVFVQSKLVIKVFLAKNAALSEHPYYIRARIVNDYQSRSLLMTVMAMVTIKYFSNFYYVTLPLLHLFFLPQIVLNSFKGYKETFSLWLVFVVFFNKAVFLIYFLGYPLSIIRYRPEYLLVIVVVFILLMQVLILYFQRFKPRFLMPRRFRPITYDYFGQALEESRLDGENNCIICMTSLEDVDNGSGDKNRRNMRTPCNHVFHQDCLVPWMVIKLNCPACRAPIPEFIE